MSSGLFRQGNQRAAKLTAQGVLEIYRRSAAGESQAAISREMQISVGQVGRIVRGEVWQELYRRYTEGLPLQAKDVDMHLAQQEINTGKSQLRQQSEAEKSLARTLELLNESSSSNTHSHSHSHSPPHGNDTELKLTADSTGAGWDKLQRIAAKLPHFTCSYTGCGEAFTDQAELVKHTLEHLK
jgi:hypothetical protein